MINSVCDLLKGPAAEPHLRRCKAHVLNESNIPYMLSGSVAMSIYIVPRATRDFDFIIHLEEKNIDQFIQHFQEGRNGSSN